jgi:hypothetical protein
VTKTTHEYIGTDIASQMFPENLSSSITLTVQSNTEPWPESWPGSFDLVHERLGLASSGQTPVRDVVANIIDLVKPGGWVEFVEADMTGGPNSSGKYMAQFGKLAESIFTAMGVRFDFALQLRSWLEEAGLEDVTERVFDVPVGAKYTNADLGDKSIRNFSNVAAMFAIIGKSQYTLMSQFKMHRITSNLDIPITLSPEELDELPTKIVKELVIEGGIQRIHVVYGRKRV